MTNDTTPTLSGSCASGNTVYLYSGVSLITSGVCDPGDTYNFTL